MSLYKCDLAGDLKNGVCPSKRWKCDGYCDEHFSDDLTVIDPKDVCKESSIFGNYYLAVDDELIKQLQNGKVLALLNEEYNFFIKRI